MPTLQSIAEQIYQAQDNRFGKGPNPTEDMVRNFAAGPRILIQVKAILHRVAYPSGLVARGYRPRDYFRRGISEDGMSPSPRVM
jgi:hypothetical protein